MRYINHILKRIRRLNYNPKIELICSIFISQKLQLDFLRIQKIEARKKIVKAFRESIANRNLWNPSLFYCAKIVHLHSNRVLLRHLYALEQSKNSFKRIYSQYCFLGQYKQDCSSAIAQYVFTISINKHKYSLVK